MIRRRCILSILAGGAVMAPLFVFGHGCEFLLAKLEVKPARVTLEITADYGANPLIEDEAAARQAVLNILEVHLGGQVRRLEDLDPLRFEQRAQWDLDAPTSMAAPPDGQPHQLLTGIWSWRPHTDKIVLAVPKKNLHDVLLWTQDEKLAGKEAKWMMLIEGDKTPEIVIWPRPPPSTAQRIGQAFYPIILGCVIVWKIRRRWGRRSARA